MINKRVINLYFRWIYGNYTETNVANNTSLETEAFKIDSEEPHIQHQHLDGHYV